VAVAAEECVDTPGIKRYIASTLDVFVALPRRRLTELLNCFAARGSSIKFRSVVFRLSREGVGIRMPALSSSVLFTVASDGRLQQFDRFLDGESFPPPHAPSVGLDSEFVVMLRSAHASDARDARIWQLVDEDEKEPR
jgi:hypothetical protein